MSQIQCPLCGAMRRSPDGDMVWVRCAECSAVVFRTTAGPEVVVAHASDAMAQVIGVVLVDTGFSPILVPSGDRVWEILQIRRPKGLVLDVALDAVMSFQLIEQVRQDESLRELKIVLVASVFNKTAYKRRPNKLYGADDYVEQHHIPDFLPAKLAALLGTEAPGIAPADSEQQQRIRDSEARTDLMGADRIRALARSIVADIALYHHDEVVSVAGGAASSPLESALGEGRRLLAEMSNPDEYANTDPIADAFAELIRGIQP